uniref:Uncharacterized protein n=1 Tax=Arundo donax TaxID=35708 RepID=A0A0A8YE25_ARUDO
MVIAAILLQVQQEEIASK